MRVAPAPRAVLLLARMTGSAIVWVITAATVACILIRPRGIAEAWWACGGAAILVACGLVSSRAAAGAAWKGMDVYLFLAGMMLLSELAREKGVFDWIAEIAASHAQHSAQRLFLLVYLAGAVVPIFLSNDATAVVLTPAVLTIVRRLKVDPVPHLLACAFIANAASFVLPISNPANLVIFSAGMPRLLEWLKIFILPSVASVLLTYIVVRRLSNKRLESRIVEELRQTKLALEGRLALSGLLLAAAALVIASAEGWSLGAPTCIAAVVAILLVTTRDRRIPLKVSRGVSWSVIPLVAGLFIIVEALQGAGMSELARNGVKFLEKQEFFIGKILAAGGVGLISNVMNNLPVGLICGNVLQGASTAPWIIRSTLIGVDLGPNLSVTGSLATILWLMALRRENVHISGWEFFKIGVVVMPLALVGSVLVLMS